MGKRKGFIHLIEIIFISIVVLLLLNQFTVIPPARSSWDREKLALIGSDLLFSLDMTGIDWFDRGQVSASIEKALEVTNVRHSVSIRNALSPSLSVGCICTLQELSILQGYLEPFAINNRTINFTVTRIEHTSPAFPVSHDAIVIGQTSFLSQNLTSLQQDMETYLSTGRGLVAFSDPLSPNEVQRGIFGLKSLPSPASGSVVFSDADNEATRKIRRLLFSIPGTNLTGRPSASFGQQANTTLSAQPGFAAPLQVEGSEAAAMILGRKDSGKTGWLLRGIENEGVLLKALVLYAAPDMLELIKADMKRPLTFSLFKIIGENDYSPGMFEAYEVILKLEFAF